MKVEDIARICHEANRAYCVTLGDHSQPEWWAAPQWQCDSAIAGVKFALSHPDATPEDNHNSWLAQKREDGWTWAPVKDAARKEHPCFILYAELPKEQQIKDRLFQAIVRAIAAAG